MKKEPSTLKIMMTLFVIMRMTVLLFYTPQGLFNVYTDYSYYYRIAQLSESGYYPFVNMWYHYPPLQAYIPQIAYWLTRIAMPAGDLLSASYQIYARILGIILLFFETGVLVLVYLIAQRVWDEEKANLLGWIYCGLSLPLFYWTFSHQVVTVFFLLLSIYWFVTDRRSLSAMALGLGIASKLIPIFELAPVAKFLWPHRQKLLVYGGVVALIVFLVYLPFLLLGGGPWVLASFAALQKVGSYGTVWAILDGNWGFGEFGPLADHLQIEKAYITHTQVPVIPGVIGILLFTVLYGLFFFRRLDSKDGRDFFRFSTLTAAFFFLWSKGWSPSWSITMIPLILLSFPEWKGLLYSLILTLLVFVEWPFAFLISNQVLLAAVYLARTLFFIFLIIDLTKELWPRKVVVELEPSDA